MKLIGGQYFRALGVRAGEGSAGFRESIREYIGATIVLFATMR